MSHPPRDTMSSSHIVALVCKVYVGLLRVYPLDWREKFGEEMELVFFEAATEAAERGTLSAFFLRELHGIPQSLVQAYWDGWAKRLQDGFQTLQEVTSSSDLPPAPPDGRESWSQTVWEMSLFLFGGLLLILGTYLPFPPLSAGWQHDIEFLGKMILPVTLSILLLGLLSGLPRWAYPFGGFFLGYQGLLARQNGLSLFLPLMLFGAFLLAIASIITDPRPSRLPAQMRRIAQSLSQDWTRFSFAFYGAMLLVIIQAFDDSHFDNRTPYLACSVLAMIVCALLYCRSRDRQLQISFLLLGLTLSIWGASLDKVTFADGLINWIIVSSHGTADDLWILKLWVQWVLLILSPYFLKTLGRSGSPRPAV